MKNRLRVAVAGLGIGRGHTRAFQNLPDFFEMGAVCDVDEARARQISDEYNLSFSTARYEDLLERDDLDLIDICTPSYLHYQQIIEALEANKHVICEKPLVGSLKEMDEIIAAERRTSKRVMPIFNYRFGRGIQKLRYLVDQGLVGTAYVATVETAWRRREEYYATPWRGKWRSEMGGTLVTHAVHEHDLLYYILGQARSVFARTTTRVHHIEVEDCTSISMEMENGALVTSCGTVGSSEQISRLRFCFANLSAESNTQPYNNSAEPWNFTPDTPEAAQRIEEALSRFELLPEGFEGQFLRYARALEKGVELPVTLADARASVELLTAIYASNWSRQPVSLPITRDHPMYAGWTPVLMDS